MGRKLFSTCILVDAGDFPANVEDELVRAEVNTHYQADMIYADKDTYPIFFDWLVEIGAIMADEDGCPAVAIQPT